MVDTLLFIWIFSWLQYYECFTTSTANMTWCCKIIKYSWYLLCWCNVLRWIRCLTMCNVTLSVYPHQAGLKVVGSIPTVARHIFQACPVWIYTQSNITQAYQISIDTTLHNYSVIQFGTKERGEASWFIFRYRNRLYLPVTTMLFWQWYSTVTTANWNWY
jgi:hypothetical protein